MCGVHNEGSYDWIIRSIENYGKYFFNGHVMDFWKYIDCGFVIVNDKHRDFFKQVIDFYNENAEMLRQVEREWHVGTDQTPVNFLIHDKNVDFKWLHMNTTCVIWLGKKHSQRICYLPNGVGYISIIAYQTTTKIN